MKQLLTKAGALLAFCLLLSGTAMAQFKTTGIVKDVKGETLIGASIIVKGTAIGTVTDFNGAFELNVPGSSAVLVFSYTGFKAAEFPVSITSNNLDVTLEDDIARLEEVVVTGLGSGVKRANAGNAVTSLTGEELTGNTSPQTVDNALFGKIPGVNISANSGAPGGGVNVQMRGVSTLGAGSSQPLYIVDGVYVDNSVIRNGRTQVSGASGGASAATQDDAANRISDLNPDDIEKIEVLKGPSAAAIYGTRANAGVIIITTKKGISGKTRVSLSQDIGVAQGQNFQKLDIWDADKITAFYGTGARGQAELAAFNNSGGRATDWEEFFYGENALLSNTQLSVSGGTDKTQFYVSGGIQTEEGIIKNTGFDRYSLRANIDHKITDRVKISFNNSYFRTDNDRGFTGNQNNTGGSIGYSIAYTPTYADLLPDANGNYPDNPYFNDNPVAVRDLSKNNQVVDRFISSASVEVDLFSNANSYLKFKMNGGADYLSGNSIVYFPEILQHQRADANPGDVMWGRQDNLNTNIQAFLQLNADLGSINSNTNVGWVRLDQEAEFLLSRGRGLAGGQTNLQWAKVQSVQQQQNQNVTDVGIVAQEDLNWQDRIIVSAGVRFDKSTLNVQQDKYYAFPKASLAANIHNFDFWNGGVMNQLKVRAAYGETGGLPLFGNTFESLTSQLVGGQLGGQVSTRGVDPNLVPETASELEFGLDAGFFNSRISLEATYYIKKVNDLILDLQPAESTGITAIATNAADLENKGIELSLSLNPVRSTNFNWFSRIMWWKNESVITRLDIPRFTTGGFGPSLGTYLISNGYSPTTIIGNPTIAESPETTGRTVYGDRQPKFQMSFYNEIKLMKNLDFTFLFHYQNGGSVINLSALLWDDGGTTHNWNGDDDGDGTPNGLDRLLAWAVDGNTGVYIQDADYLKLREVGLYYTFPKIASKFIERAKIGVSANNILLWTKYDGYDPEASNFGTQAVTGNIDVAPYPSSRRLFFHLKLDF